MINLFHIVSVPILAFNLGFVKPHIDLNHNIRETYKAQVIKQKQGTSKSDKLESFRTKRSFRNRDFGNKLRERFNQSFGDQRSVAQFYVHSWFITSFSLDLDDNTLLRVRDIYAKAISEVGIATKGSNRRGREWREKRKVLGKIHSTFDRELQKTLDAKQYERLKKMTRRNSNKEEVDRGET